MKLSKDPSLTPIIIETLRRHVPSRFYMWLDDLHKLTDECVEVILHECPFLARPENDDDLPIIREDRHNPKLQLTLQKKVIPDHNLVFATNSNTPNRLNNATVHHHPDRFFTTFTSTKGFVTTSRTPINESEHPNSTGDISHLAICHLKPPPQNTRLYSFGNFSEKWSWAILSSPYEQYSFSHTPVKIFTTAFISHQAFPQKPDNPPWNCEVWRIARSIPNDAAVSFLWKYLNHVVQYK